MPLSSTDGGSHACLLFPINRLQVRGNSSAIARTGRVGKHSVWRNEENATVRAFYPDIDAICRALPHRTRKAIRYQAHNLGLTPKLRPWSGSDIARLRRIFPTATDDELMAAFPERTLISIKAQAGEHGFRRARRCPNEIGFPLVDAIRRRAFDLNLSLADLDREARSGTYFRRMNRKTFSPSWRHIAHAIKLLGGEQRIDWVL
jgi:hypothetical protein